MDPKIWGEKCWFFLHTVSLNYPVEPENRDINKHRDYINNLCDVLPCNICKSHFVEYIREHPPCLDNRRCFVNWVLDFHNSVNERTGKPVFLFDQFIDEYSCAYSREKKKKKRLYVFALILVLILILFLRI